MKTMNSLPETYKALYALGPLELELRQVPVSSLGPNDVFISIEAAGICGTDLGIYDGSLPYLKMGGAKYPIVPGHEWSGKVVALGEAVTRFKIGDLVVGECHQGCYNCEYCRRGAYNMCPNRVRMGIEGRAGGYAEYAVTDQRTLHHAPVGITSEEAALVEPTTVAFHGVEKVSSMLGKRVLVLGCGPIGLLSLRLAKLLGAAQIVAVDVLPKRLDLALEYGADITVRASPDRPFEELPAQIGPVGFEVVLEVTGQPRLIEPALQMAVPRAEVVLLSLYEGHSSNIKADLIVTRELTVYGTLGSPSIWERTIALINQGHISLKPLITHVFSLTEAQKALSLAHQKADESVKVLIKP